MSGAVRLAARGLGRRYWLGGGAFGRGGIPLHAVEDVTLDLHAGETLALVGESGCGKSTLARMLALLEPPSAGSVAIDGETVEGPGRAALKPLRRRIQMVFQDPYDSLNPRLPVGSIIAEPLAIHGVGDRDLRRRKAAALAEQVGIPADHLDRYPHQFSGGQRQRIAIARALALEPDVIVADEPLSALDVSIQSQILNLLADLRARLGLTYLFVSHDLAVVRHFADRVAVMYLGRIVELAETRALFADPRHPYTRALIAAAPRVGAGKRQPGRALAGDVPSPLDPPPGCAFHPRCPMAADVCRAERPALVAPAGAAERLSACHFRDDMADTAEAAP